MTIEAGLSPELGGLIQRCRPYTLTSTERLAATADAVEYVIGRGVPGAFVECGVWKGGSVLAMLLTLQRMEVTDREVWLYDTFEGMTEPGEKDTDLFGNSAQEAYARDEHVFDGLLDAANFSIQRVQRLLASSGYPENHLRYVQGPVEETIPAEVPDQIALLRLDTDWYESTKHELEHLYPRLAPGAVLIIDDYGHFHGAREAVDEFLAQSDDTLLLARTDYSGRVAVRPG